ncbi:DinB family protein [Psychrobacillus vulpis]|uniref:DinB family protein n=1 Tax=Psychrobacillus vulpis TaxID=2325572 RepID=A0A544TL44_9BACI|nr:DinB family protein [Psychrobacillus vulpis]TQR18187.1 DinB family protein [Psychrobacillus vulpis]
MKKEEILEYQQNYVNWLDSLQDLPEEKALAPYKEGKWSPNEIVMHLGEWDRFTLEQRIPNMREGEKFESFPNFEAFNEKAAARAHEQTFKETLSYAKQQRQSIIEHLQAIDEIEWDKVFYIGEHEVSIRSYFTDFIDHDNHHKKQILHK